MHAEDFGFLVPTPSPPEIAEASDAVFAELRSLFQPEPEPISFVPKDRAFAPSSASVTVLEEKRVGSMDVAVLQATDVEALINWLNGNGYKQNPQQKDWLNRCVKLGMTVSAFKYAGGQTDVKVTADSVRLSFRTDRPFFPYHEPKRDADGRRRLNLYVIAPTPVTALRGQRSEDYVANASAMTVSIDKNSLRSPIAGVMIPANATQVTYFDDRSRQRAPGDLYFVSAPKAGE